MQQTHLLVMAKSPVPGRVKTRLCPPLTGFEAAAVAEAALADTLEAVAACGAGRKILALEGEPGPWLPEGFEVVAQVEGTFNERLAAAWAHAGGPGLQIGMDTPQITAGLLDESLAVIEAGNEAALGMAEDGGWWALGLARAHPEAFDGVPMSRDDTGARQREQLEALGLAVAELPVLRDLDDAEDARAIATAAPGTRTARKVAELLEPAPAEVDVVLPVLNERDAIPWVLERMPKGFNPIVVDNGSDDGSAEVAAEHGAQVVSESRRGFGAACFAGLEAATAPVVSFMDCDASLDPSDLEAICAPVLDGEADLVLGARRAEAGALPLHGRIANRYLARRVRKYCGADVSDIGPMRAARREALLGLGITDRRSGWPLEMVLRAGLADWRIRELPVPYTARIGKSKVTGTVGGTLKAVKDMRAQLALAREAARHR